MPSISWLRSPGLRGARTGIHSRFRRRCSPALSYSRARCSASRSLARFYLLSCLPISFLSSYFFPTVVAAAARRNGRDFLTASHALRPFRCCFIPAAGCSGAGLSSCLQPILLCRTSWAHSRRRGSDSCRLRLIQPQRGCARFGSNCRLGASPSFLIRATRAQIVDRQIGRDRGVPISPHLRSSSGRRYAGPRPRPIIDANSQQVRLGHGGYGSDRGGAADRGGSHALVYARHWKDDYRRTLPSRCADSASGAGTAIQSMNLSSFERLPPCAPVRLW